MSRLIVKNIPTALNEKQLAAQFQKMGVVTDVQIVKKGGKSRRFCFVGYKTPQQAMKAQKYFNRTYIGTSKVEVEFAKTRDQLDNLKQKEKTQHTDSVETKKGRQSGGKEQSVQKKFESYKSILEKGSQQSWNDLLVGEDVMVEAKPRKMKKDVKQEKIEAKIKQKGALLQKQMKNTVPAIHIKAPKLSQRNQQYIRGPLKIDQSRLYVTNFPNHISEQELIGAFQKYGIVSAHKLPKNQDGSLKGYGFITFQKPQQALRAFTQLDNKILFGRILHIKPALQDIGGIIRNKRQEEYQLRIKEKYGDSVQDKTSYKKKKKAQMRRRLEDTTSWNTLFLNPNTLLEYMARRNNVTKSEILMSENLPIKMALAETQVIDQTKEWMKSQRLSLDFLETDRNLCERSKSIILVKNLNYNTQASDLKELFSYYGVVDRLLLCPNRTIAIVEFQSEQFAQNAFDKLSYYKFKSNPLYLQWAPIGILSQQKIAKVHQKQLQQQQNLDELGKVLYVKNLNFGTAEDTLRRHLHNTGNIRSVKIIKDKQGNPLGYGFVEYQNKQDVLKAIKIYQNSLLEGHTLQLSVSKKNTQQLVNRRKKQQLDFQPVSPKLVVRNIAFQATKHDVRDLFKEFGTVKSVRLPKKMDGQHRGFAFVQFQTIEESKQAYLALSNSHLYGRKLVVEWEQNSNR